MKKNQFERILICDLCGSGSNNLFVRTRDFNYRTGEYTYIVCEMCGLIRLSPRPKRSYLDKFYPKKYHAHKSVFKKNKINIFFREILKHNKFIARFFIFDDLFYFKPKGKILDVGAGGGSYVEILKNWGWESYGVELSEQAVLEANKKGVEIKNGDLLSAKYKANSFDVVRYCHVLEHVPYPTKELKEVKRILKRGGEVRIIVPNARSLSFFVFNKYWYHLDAPRHFFQFTPDTIVRYLEKAKFKDIKIKFIQSPYPILRSLMYRLGKHNVENRFGVWIYPFSILVQILNILKISDVIEVSAKK